MKHYTHQKKKTFVIYMKAKILSIFLEKYILLLLKKLLFMKQSHFQHHQNMTQVILIYVV